jgi:hypothetical protein
MKMKTRDIKRRCWYKIRKCGDTEMMKRKAERRSRWLKSKKKGEMASIVQAAACGVYVWRAAGSSEA